MVYILGRFNIFNTLLVFESFSVTNGVKQGYVLSPKLFSIFLLAMLDEAFRNMGDGVYIQSRQIADLFNVAHFRAKTKTAYGPLQAASEGKEALSM